MALLVKGSVVGVKMDLNVCFDFCIKFTISL